MLTMAKVRVGGYVQGVGFRYFVKTMADKYGIKGYVKNLNTGEVETEAQGESEIVEQFIQKLKRGNSYSQVKSFSVSYLEEKCKYSKFEIVYE
jgi:acylphosphatase